MRVVAYLKGTASKSIKAPVRRMNMCVWDCYVDSDWAGDKEISTRSHTGMVFLCNGAPVKWLSKKQIRSSCPLAATVVSGYFASLTCTVRHTKVGDKVHSLASASHCKLLTTCPPDTLLLKSNQIPRPATAASLSSRCSSGSHCVTLAPNLWNPLV